MDEKSNLYIVAIVGVVAVVAMVVLVLGAAGPTFVGTGAADKAGMAYDQYGNYWFDYDNQYEQNDYAPVGYGSGNIVLELYLSCVNECVTAVKNAGGAESLTDDQIKEACALDPRGKCAQILIISASSYDAADPSSLDTSRLLQDIQVYQGRESDNALR